MLQLASLVLCAVFLSVPIPLVSAQQAADGLIVPFTSDLPACASLCGPLFDVQGACTPPNIADTSSSCFCSDARLRPFLQGPSGVSSVCGTASCSQSSDLQAVENWYSSYCNSKQSKPTATSGSGSGSAASGTSGQASSSGSSSGGGNQGWFSTHWKWVVMLVVLVCVITGLWIMACLLRRRYIRKKEREFEMRPPIALGPHQLQAMSGGYNSGDGNMDHSKEARVDVTSRDSTTRSKRESKGLRKQRT